MNIPTDLRYSREHEWVRVNGSIARIGITDFAQDSLGDVVFVQLPEPDADIDGGATFGEVESTKSVSDVYAPVAGKVVVVNTDLTDAPQRLNEDPYGEGWICVIEPSDPDAFAKLLDAEAYRALIAD